MMKLDSRRRGSAATAALSLLVVAVIGACSSNATTTASTTSPIVDHSSVSTTSAISQESVHRLSTGCGEPRPYDIETDVDTELDWSVGEQERTGRLFVPSSYDSDIASALIVNLHGSGSTAERINTQSNLPQRAGQEAMITVAPQAQGPDWEMATEGADVEFIGAVVDDLTARYCIDLDRVYGVGMSLGAWKMASTACASPGRFAALALVTVEVFPAQCEPMAVTAFHGTADVLVPYGAGGDEVVAINDFNAQLPGALDNVAAWAASAGCADEPDRTRFEPDVSVIRYNGCERGVAVELYTLHGAGHTWPGTPNLYGPETLTNQTIDATDLIVKFFQDHPRGDA